MGILDGKRILVAGVTMDSSIGFAVARVAQEQGATVVVSNFGRALGITRRIVKRLPQEAPVIELDVTDPEHLERLPGLLARARRRPRRRRALDRLRQPGDAARRQVPRRPLGGRRAGGAGLGVLAEVAVDRLPAADGSGGGSVVGMTFDATVAWPAYDWMGVAKAGLESTLALPRPRPRPAGRPGQPGLRRSAEDPGRQGDPRLRGPRVVVEGPRAAGLGRVRPRARRREAVVALLSDFFPATTGEIVHVDGGFHAMGAVSAMSTAYRPVRGAAVTPRLEQRRRGGGRRTDRLSEPRPSGDADAEPPAGTSPSTGSVPDQALVSLPIAPRRPGPRCASRSEVDPLVQRDRGPVRRGS